MYCYKYEGTVIELGRLVTSKWISYTYAVTEKKARSNLMYQFKKQFGKTANAKISLPGDITLVSTIPNTLVDDMQISMDLNNYR